MGNWGRSWGVAGDCQASNTQKTIDENKMMNRWITVILSVLFLTGCASVNYTSDSANADNKKAPPPDSVNYYQPDSDIPDNIKNLMGRWEGNWNGQLNSYMIFEEVTTTEAKLIYGWGTLPSWGINQAGNTRHTATINIKDTKSKVDFSFTKHKGSLSADGKTIDAVYNGRSLITMKKTEGPFGKLSATSSKVRKKKAIIPADIVYQKPADDIPSSIQGILGQWEGELNTGQHVFGFVEKVTPDKAFLVYSWGTNPRTNVRNGGYTRHIADLRPRNDELSFSFSMGRGLPPLFGSLSPDGKSVTANSDGFRVSLSKIAEPVFGSEIERYNGVKTGLIVIKNVNLITMRDDNIIPSQTVVIQDGRIKRVLESDSADIPPGATIIEGEGEKYLMPGLADMHIHLNRSSYLKLLVANGVTTVRNMWGKDFHRILREDINHKQRVGPTIYSTGALLDGFPKYWPQSTGIRTVEDARNAVHKTKEDGFDFVKVYDRLSEENYNAIISTARELDIPVVGHIPFKVGFYKAIEAGQYSFEHLYGATERTGDWMRKKKGNLFKDYLEQSVDSGVWNCPTLVNFQIYEHDRSDVESQPELKYMNSDTIEYWKKSPVIDLQDQGRQNRLDTVKALNDAGANLVLGTDTPNSWAIPGFSIHGELSLLVESGLTPYEAIKTGTVNAATHMKKRSEFGTIEKGKRADLILCNANPFDDVANISSPTGVMTNGIWYPRAALDQMLEEVETEVQMLGGN